MMTHTNKRITSHHLPELSGLTTSTRRPNELWAINDSGNSSRLYRLDESLNVVQIVKLKPDNRDWEDLSSYTDGQYTWIVIAETGDNNKKHKKAKLYFYREDKLLSADKKRLLPDRILRFNYPTSPQDVEAIAIDPALNEIILISKKNTKSPKAYSLKLNGKNKQTAVSITKLKHLKNASKFSVLAAKLTRHNLDAVTAMDISKDGSKAVVLTYTDVWLYQREAKQSWNDAFKIEPQHLGRHRLQQAEAISFSLDDTKIWVTSERLPAPLVEIKTP